MEVSFLCLCADNLLQRIVIRRSVIVFFILSIIVPPSEMVLRIFNVCHKSCN